MKRTDEKGFSVVEGLVVVLVLCVLGFAGWFVWRKQQNAPVKKDDSVSVQSKTTKTSDDAKNPSMLVGKINDGFGVSLTFQYPEAWKLASEIDGSMPLSSSRNTVETVTITSPNGRYVVKYRVGANGGLGGSCDPTTGAKLLSLETSTVTGYPAVKFVELRSNRQPSVPAVAGEESKVVYKMALMDAARVTESKVGASDCQTYLAEVMKLRTENNVTLLEASINSKNLTEDSSAADFQAMLRSDEYKTAKMILLSTTVK